MVTNIDTLLHTFLSEELTAVLPHSNVLSEEGVTQKKYEGMYWIIDPIDGTKNFANGSPAFALSIALQENRDTKLAVVYAPVPDVLFATTNTSSVIIQGDPKKIFPAETTPSILLDNGTSDETKQLHSFLRENLHSSGYETRALECASLQLCLVATHLYTGFIHRGLRVWDIAAGVLIAQRAYIQVTNFTNEPKNIFTPDILAVRKVEYET